MLSMEAHVSSSKALGTTCEKTTFAIRCHNIDLKYALPLFSKSPCELGPIKRFYSYLSEKNNQHRNEMLDRFLLMMQVVIRVVYDTMRPVDYRNFICSP